LNYGLTDMVCHRTASDGNITGLQGLERGSLRKFHGRRDCQQHDAVNAERLGQCRVDLDFNARGPARWPDDIRTPAAAQVVPVSRTFDANCLTLRTSYQTTARSPVKGLSERLRTRDSNPTA
jgi:hypothetical protein